MAEEMSYSEYLGVDKDFDDVEATKKDDVKWAFGCWLAAAILNIALSVFGLYFWLQFTALAEIWFFVAMIYQIIKALPE